MALIEIDGLPIKNGDFPWQTVSHNQRVPQTMARIPWDQRLRLGVALTSWRRHLATAVPTARP